MNGPKAELKFRGTWGWVCLVGLVIALAALFVTVSTQDKLWMLGLLGMAPFVLTVYTWFLDDMTDDGD